MCRASSMGHEIPNLVQLAPLHAMEPVPKYTYNIYIARGKHSESTRFVMATKNWWRTSLEKRLRKDECEFDALCDNTFANNNVTTWRFDMRKGVVTEHVLGATRESRLVGLWGLGYIALSTSQSVRIFPCILDLQRILMGGV